MVIVSRWREHRGRESRRKSERDVLRWADEHLTDLLDRCDFKSGEYPPESPGEDLARRVMRVYHQEKRIPDYILTEWAYYKESGQP